MSVFLTPVKNTAGDEYEGLHLSNGTWAHLTKDVPGVERWPGIHDRQEYTPEQLRAIAAKHPEWQRQLEFLATLGGAVLG